jgi:hypothetical protein
MRVFGISKSLSIYSIYKGTYNILGLLSRIRCDIDHLGKRMAVFDMDDGKDRA